jgi:hypothetical protein
MLLPNISSPRRIHHAAVNDGEGLAEAFFHLSQPLVFQMAGNTDESALHEAPVLEFFE